MATSVPTKELVDKIFLFCESIAKNRLFPYQAQLGKRIIRSLLTNDGDEITALFSRQSGKSETVACIVSGVSIILPILANMPMFLEDERLMKFQKGFRVGIFAPALPQAQIIFSRVKDNLSNPNALPILKDPEINVNFGTFNGQNVTLHFDNLNISSVITCLSASEGANIEGNSYMLIVCDESQDISNFKYYKSISPMAAFYNGTKVLIGTATTRRGFFFDSIERNKKDRETGEKGINHFQNDWKVVCKYNPNYQKYVEGELKRLGADSDEFQMSYCLKWIFEHGMFVTVEKFTKEPIADPNKGLIPFDHKKVHVAGIDCGKQADSTVVTIGEVDFDNPIIIEQSPDPNVDDFIVYDVVIKNWLELQGDDWDAQYYAVMDFIRNYNVTKIIVDATGVGSPMADRLAVNAPVDEVIPYVFSTQSRSEMFKFFDTHIKQGRFHYPADEETKETHEFQKFIEQFINAEKSYSGQHMIVQHSNERNAHDDYVFSAALMVWGCKGDVSKPQTSENKFFEKGNQSFYKSRNNVTARRRR